MLTLALILVAASFTPGLTTEQWKLLEYAGYGFLGALVASMVKERSIRLPTIYIHKDTDGVTRRYVDPGFIGAALLGAIIAAIMDGRPQTAIAYGVASAFVGLEILKPIIAGVMGILGKQVEFSTGSAGPNLSSAGEERAHQR